MRTSVSTVDNAAPTLTLGQHTLRHGFYAAVLVIVLTLTGLFNSFEGRVVLGDDLTLSTVLVLGALLATGLLAATPQRHRDLVSVLLNGAVGSLIAGVGLALIVLLTEAVDVRFVFPNLGQLLGTAVTLGETDLLTGILVLLAISLVMGVVAGLVVYLPARVRDTLFIALSLTLTAGILQGQINNVIALPDALTLVGVFALAYGVARVTTPAEITMRAGVGLAVGLVTGGGLALLAGNGALTLGSKAPQILGLATNGNLVFFLIVIALVGVFGAIMTRVDGRAHSGAWALLVVVLILGILSWQREMNLLTGALSFGLIGGTLWLLPMFAAGLDARYVQLPRSEQRITRTLVFAALLAVLMVVPPFAGLSITNTINLTALYVTMGIGLSVMIGYAGLLDLGYVASYAIGAYTIGLLTTPSLLTCGGMTADMIIDQGLTVQQACTGVMTFWEGLPVAVLVSSLSGMMLGVPVLRLRGDYLAIVTLGFGEIIQVLIKSNTFKPLLGGAQGIIQIPLPQLNLSFLNPAWNIQLTKSTEVYYLYIFAVMVAAFVVLRLVNTRLGRAWRAMREDEDVAEAMGIHLVGTKLLAFGISSAFAGLGGAVFGASFQSIFPNSFTLLVSINVLSLIIIGGMGSIPGVMLGAFMLIGLPEVLRELQDYRLLVFGALLVAVMLLKPDGLIPPQPPRLSERAREAEESGLRAG